MNIITAYLMAFAILSAQAQQPSGPAMGASLDPSIPSPQPVGALITWTATASNANPGTLWYRFRARRAGNDFHVVVDYGPNNALDWTESAHEGAYEIEVSIRNITTGDATETVAPFFMQSRVTGSAPIINPTSHPMVFLYSAPACPSGARMRVQFQSSDGFAQNTPFQPCSPGLSMNFYLAGLRGQTTYSVSHTIDTGSNFQQGPVLKLTTPQARTDLASQTVIQKAPASAPQQILLEATLATNTLATDLNGNLVWYYPGKVSSITRPSAGGYFFGIVEDPSSDPSQQVMREFDLTGMTALETNAARVSEQLVAMGKRPINAFHHEARRLPDGKILVLAAVEQIFTDVQGPGPVDILGDMIVIMDSNLQVVWTWDAFDHLDVTRQATLNDSCVSNSAGNCPPLYLASNANDWLHGNSVQQTPDGALLYSTRSQDWVVKINYDNGNGGGDVIWLLGLGGDFQINSTDPSPWFSHQHDPQFLSDGVTMTLFDDGNVRQASDPSANSRGQVIQVDEQNRVANLVLNVDLGTYSFALGSAQKLADGNYLFDVGYLTDGTGVAMEVDSTGNTVYALHAGAPQYRSFRMSDLYTP